MSEATDELLETVGRWLDSFNSHDMENIRQFYYDDFITVPPDAPTTVGWESGKVRVQRYLEQGFSRVKHDIQEVKVQGSVGLYSPRYTFFDDKDKMVMSGKALVVFLKDLTTGEWKIAAVMFTKD